MCVCYVGRRIYCTYAILGAGSEVGKKEQSVTATELAGEELPLAPGGREIGLRLEERRSVSPSGQHTPEGGGMFQRQG